MGFRNLLLICTFAIQVSAAYGEEPGVSDSEIRLGMVNSQTGPSSLLGQGMYSGAQAVFNDINANGGIYGRKITLFVDDDAYDPDKSIDKTLAMINEKNVFALFGYVGTPTTNAVIPIVKDTKIPLIGLFTGAMFLRSPVTPEVINIRASYQDEAEILVDYFVQNKGAKHFAVFFQDDAFGLATLKAVELALEHRDLKVTAKSSFQRGTMAVKEGLGVMLENAPDVVIMAGSYASLAEFIKQAKIEKLTANLATVSFIGTNKLAELVGPDGDGLVISQVMPFPTDTTLPITNECKALLKTQGEELGFVNLEGCITAKAMVIALKNAGRNLTRTGLLSAFESFKEMDIGGITLNLSADNHQALNTLYLTEIQAGKIIPIKKVENIK